MQKLMKLIPAILLAGGTMMSTAAVAEEVVISAASSFPKGTLFSRNFERWIEEVNAAGKGLVRLDYKGGAPAIGSPFQLMKKAQQGVFHMVNSTGASERLPLITRTGLKSFRVLVQYLLSLGLMQSLVNFSLG